MKRFLYAIVLRLATNPAWSHIVALFCILAMLLLSGCRTQKSVVSDVEKDSVRLEVRERVVTVMDTVYFEVPAQEKETVTRDTTSTLNTDYAVSVASILADGSLFHSLKNKTQNVPVPTEAKTVYRDSVVYVFADKVQTAFKEVEVEKKPSFWERLKDVGLGLVVGVVLILLVRRIKSAGYLSK